MLTDDPTEYPYTPTPGSATRPTVVIGFQDDRQALLTRLEWVDPVPSDPDQRMRHVDVAVSTTSPVGPWAARRHLGPERGRPTGASRRSQFETPTWARFVRLTGDRIKKKDTYYVEEPATVRVIEAPTERHLPLDPGRMGPRQPARTPRVVASRRTCPVVADAQDDDDTPETARTLTPGTTGAGRVHRDEDVDWYSVTIPEGQNSIAITVGGVPAVGVSADPVRRWTARTCR